MKPSSTAWLTGGLTYVIAQAVYVRTLAPGLLLGDSAEFQTLVYTLGMTHPTGYPVYLLLARLFAFLPVGSPAWRVSLFSAFAGALAAGLLAYLSVKAGAHPLAAFAAGIAAALAPLFWWQAVIAELYTLSALLILVVIALLAAWVQTRRPVFLFLAGLTGGLSIGIHNTVILLFPAVLVTLLTYSRSRKDWLASGLGAVCGALFTLAAFYVIDRHNPPSSYYFTTFYHGISAWGIHPEQTQSFIERMKFLISAPQFRGLMFTDPAVQMPLTWAKYWEELQANLAPGVLVLAGLGLLTGLIRRQTRPLALLAGLGWLGLVVFILNYEIGDINVFYVPTYALVCLSAGLGAAGLAAGLGWLARRLCLPVWSRLALNFALGVGLAALMLAPQAARSLSAWQAGKVNFLARYGYDQNYPYPVNDPTGPYERATQLVDNLPPDAIIFVGWDEVFADLYVAHVERGLTGMSFREIWVQDWDHVEDSTLAYIDANLGTRPIYLAFQPNQQINARYQTSRVFLLPGVYEVVRRK